MKKEGKRKTEEQEKIELDEKDLEWANSENTSPKGQPVEIQYIPSSKQYILIMVFDSAIVDEEAHRKQLF